MKGIKLYALLGSLTVAIACVPPMVVADTPNKPAAADADQPVFNEMDAGNQSRQMRLDELFAGYDHPESAKPAAQKRIPTAPVRSTYRSKSLSKQPQAQAAKPTPIVAKHAQPKAKTGESELAIYKGGSDQAALAVSHAVMSNSTTPVIAASLDRPGTVPKYKAGDHMVIRLKALQDCNIMVFDYDNKGTITQLYPNDFDRTAVLHSGQQVELGGDDSKYTLDVNGGGLEQIFVYAYPTDERPIEVAMLTPVEHTPFRAAHMTRSQYDQLISRSLEYRFAPANTVDRSVSLMPKDGQKVDMTAKELPSSSKSEHQIAIGGAVPARAQKPANKIELVFQIEN